MGKINWQIVGVMAFSLALGPVAGAGTSASLTLSGSVPAATHISVTGTGAHESLDLSASQSGLLVAQIREINNTPGGYQVRVSSGNQGKLANGAVASIAYGAEYDGVPVDLSSGASVVTDVRTASGVVNSVKPLRISFTGSSPQSLMSGTYSDTLTFTISAN